MTSLRPLLWAALALLLSAVLQGRLSHALHVRWAQPDFLLITLACAGTLLGGSRGTFLGLWAGLLTAVLIPGTFGTILTSRTLAGALAGYLQRFVIRDNLAVPPLVVLLVTLAAESVFALMAPGALVTPGVARHSFRLWLEKAGGEALYNTLLALPVYWLLRRLGLDHATKDHFGPRFG